jgi:hypothetical protein
LNDEVHCGAPIIGEDETTILTWMKTRVQRNTCNKTNAKINIISVIINITNALHAR